MQNYWVHMFYKTLRSCFYFDDFQEIFATVLFFMWWLFFHKVACMFVLISLAEPQKGTNEVVCPSSVYVCVCVQKILLLLWKQNKMLDLSKANSSDIWILLLESYKTCCSICKNWQIKAASNVYDGTLWCLNRLSLLLVFVMFKVPLNKHQFLLFTHSKMQAEVLQPLQWYKCVASHRLNFRLIQLCIVSNME